MAENGTPKPIFRDRFPNYAGVSDIDDALASELDAAGITVHRYGFLKDGRREVNTEVAGELHGWGFRRAWCYWVAEGPGIELAAAEKLHATHGQDVRVEGHCGCPSPREQFKGLAVGSYHVDRPSGLQALADTIRDLVERAAAPPGPWRPQLTGADRLGRDRKGDVTINVPTALCWLQFRPDVSTGTEEETRPGVGFTLVAYPGSAGEWPSGVIPRDQAFRLYEMLGRFFAAHPPSGEPAAKELEAAAADAAPVQADRLRRIAAALRGPAVGGSSRG